MSDFFQIIILSIVQGITEFLPVSSSGHLVLAKRFMGFETPENMEAALEVFLHAGTLAAVVIFYRRKLLALLLGIFKMERTSILYAVWIALSMIPAGIVYALGGKGIDAKFENPLFVAWALIATGLFLAATALVDRATHSSLRGYSRSNPACAPLDSSSGLLRGYARNDGGRFAWFHALAMGVAQAVALLPGVSRSGSTIATARLLGVSPKEAAEFSFIMSIPVIAGATLLKLVKHANDITVTQSWQYALGAVVAGLVGLVAIKSLVVILGRGKLWIFGIYCVVIGIAALILL